MSTENRLQESSPRKVYRLESSWRNRLMSLSLLMVLIAFGILYFSIRLLHLWIMRSSLGCVVMFCFFAFLFSAALEARFAVSARLFTSPKGIEYHVPGYSVRTTWDNIERIGKVRFGLWTVEGLILRQPAMRAGKWFVWYLRLRRADYVIPLIPFMEKWRSMELGQYLMRYATHAYEGAEPELHMDAEAQLARDEMEKRLHRFYETSDKVRKVLILAFILFLMVICIGSFIVDLFR
jgi:hypothetical protein